MADRLRVAVIGAGYFSRFHYQAWAAIEGVELVAACDHERAKVEALAGPLGVHECFTDCADLLAATEPDLVDIATPEASHAELVALCAGRGIATICQKPLAPDLAAARALVESAEAGGGLLVVHENFRFMPWFREAKSLLQAGLLGEPHAVAFRLRPGDGRGPDAYLERQPYLQTMERFLIHETAIHLVDSFRYLLGEIGGVFARLRRLNPAIAGEDAGYLLFDFASGASGLFDGNRLNDHVADDQRLTMGELLLEGSEAALRLDGFGRLWLKPLGGPERAHDYAWHNDGSFGAGCVDALQRHVAAHLKTGTALENTGRDYLRNLEIEEALYRSHQGGRWVDV